MLKYSKIIFYDESLSSFSFSFKNLSSYKYAMITANIRINMKIYSPSIIRSNVCKSEEEHFFASQKRNYFFEVG